jgi:hypothetical protein
MGERRSLLSDPKVDMIYYSTNRKSKLVKISKKKPPKVSYQASEDWTLNVIDRYGKVKYYFYTSVEFVC